LRINAELSKSPCMQYLCCCKIIAIASTSLKRQKKVVSDSESDGTDNHAQTDNSRTMTVIRRILYWTAAKI
jgi:hypothetical protein